MGFSKGQRAIRRAVLAGLVFWAGAVARADTYFVEIIDFAFVPRNLAVNVGDTVVWVQRDFDLHTTTSGLNGVPDGLWDSGDLNFNVNPEFGFTFTASGVFPYFCRHHAGLMRGTISVSGAASSPPTVRITSPAHGTVFRSPTTVTIQATASDPDGRVTQVEFFDNGQTLGVDPGAPFSVTFRLESGTHVLTAVATDNSGTRATSPPVTVSVGTTGAGPLTVNLTSPADGAIVTLPASVTLEAVASDPDDRITQVEFFDGTRSLGVDSGSPYRITVMLEAGTHTLSARATNVRGVTAISQTVAITVRDPFNRPPTTQITTPANGTNFRPLTPIPVEASANDPDGAVRQVEFFANNQSLGVVISRPFRITFAPSPGTYTLFARATDNAGATGTSPPVTITVGAVNVPPSVQITSPTNRTVFAQPATFVISATATDPDDRIARVEFFASGTFLGFDTDSPYSLQVTLTTLGDHALTARAINSQGVSATSPAITVTVTSGPTAPPLADPIPARIPRGPVAVELQSIASGFVAPIGMAVPDDGTGRIFIYDQTGIVYVLAQGAIRTEPLLDVRSRLVPLGIAGPGTYDERGLLGLAVHPQFARHPLLYTYTSEPVAGTATFTTPMPANRSFDHQSVIAEWRIDPRNPNRVDPTSRRELMRIDQPQFNHNGGTLRFGPDDMLYIALGDGGGADDIDGQLFGGLPMAGHGALGNGQNVENVYGAILRIHVDARTSANGRYGIPADNPFVGRAGVDEIFAFGFRNPYSFSFDRVTGQLYVGDTGQNDVEEVNIVTRGGNYGWNVKEGTFFFQPNGGLPGFVSAQPARSVPAGLINPIAQYDHDEGLAVIGGFVYRGTQIPALQGRYVFGDYHASGANFTGRLFYLDASNAIRELQIGRDNRTLGFFVKGFGEAADGELYVIGSQREGASGTTGQVWKIVPLDGGTLRLVRTQITGATLSLSWTGGTGPYQVQRKNSLSDINWTTVLTTAGTTASIPIQGRSGFFRVIASN